MKTPTLTSWRTVWPAVAIAVISGALIFAWWKIHYLAVLTDGDRATLLKEYAKSICNFLLIIVLGAAISAFVGVWEDLKERRRESAIFRKGILDGLGEAYRIARKSRGGLRAAGLIRETCEPSAELNPEQQEAYTRTMEDLIEIQLNLTRLRTEVHNFPKAFKMPNDLANHIESMEAFLAGLINEYETNASKAATGHRTANLGSLDALKEFVGPACAGPFTEQYCHHYSEATKIIRMDVLGVKS